MNGMIHYARLSESKRLQKVLKYLSDGQPHTTFEIIMGTGQCAINSIITELRRNGLRIACTQVKGQRGVYQYQMGR
jgi:hypothetical protein